MVQLRLYTFDAGGNETVTAWSFNPLDDQDEYAFIREAEASATGAPRRRPFIEREARTLTLGAGLLKSAANWNAFRTMLRAHRIAWYRKIGIGSKASYQWIEFVLDAQDRVTLERLEEVSRLKRAKITLIQKQGLSFKDFGNTDVQLSDGITQ